MMKYIGIFFRLGGYLLRNLFWIHRWAKHKEKHTLEERYARIRKVILRVNKGLHVEYHVEGIENIPAHGEKFFAVPNHQSMLDPLVLFPYLEEPVTFVAKKEAAKVGIVKDVVELLDGIFIDRSNLRQEMKVIRTVIHSLEEDHVSWVVFPEGHRTRNENYEMNEFKPGTFKIAIDSHKTILPIAIYGGFRPLSKKWKRKKYPIQIRFLKPIPYEEYQGMKTLELAKMVEDIVRENVDELRKRDQELMKKPQKKKKKK